MQLCDIYKCLSDYQRLRIVNLLADGPLCVCHLIEILEADSIKMSKQLRYMKELDVLRVERDANWMIYSLNSETSALIMANLGYLHSLTTRETRILLKDLKKRKQIMQRLLCCEARAPVSLREYAANCC